MDGKLLSLRPSPVLEGVKCPFVSRDWVCVNWTFTTCNTTLYSALEPDRLKPIPIWLVFDRHTLAFVGFYPRICFEPEDER